MSYNDPKKHEARVKMREFIQKYLFSIKKPLQTKVVCFPGAEVEGEEALEVKEVYDSLGIPRANVVGLEYDANKAQRLERANLGIRVVNALDAIFFEKTGEKFDVISLDYTGHQTNEAVHSLELIAGRQVLQPYGILCTNYAAKRESKALQLLMFHRWTRQDIIGDPNNKLDDIFGGNFYKDRVEKLRRII